MKPPQAAAIPRQLALALDYVEVDSCLVIHVGRESLGRLAGDGRVAGDELGHCTAHGLEAELVYKVNEGRPHIGDRLLNREIDLVINTPLGRESFFDDRTLRRIATVLCVPCVTTLTGAAATVSAIRALREETLDVRPLQDYHAEPART